jgi:hypothetical protein
MIHVDPALSAPQTPPLTAPAPPLPARALIEGQMAMLSRLAEIGMEIAEACGRDARAAANADPQAPARASPHEIGLVFARVARAVRMTIALQQRLAGDLADLDRADARAQSARRLERRVRLSRMAGQAAEAAIDARRRSGLEFWSDEEAIEADIERLSSETLERLIDAEDGDLWGRPFDEVVAGIAKDLGLSPEWTARLRGAVQPPMTAPIPVGMVEGEGPIPDDDPLTVILGRSGPRARPEAGPRINAAAQARGPGGAVPDG